MRSKGELRDRADPKLHGKHLCEFVPPGVPRKTTWKTLAQMPKVPSGFKIQFLRLRKSITPITYRKIKSADTRSQSLLQVFGGNYECKLTWKGPTNVKYLREENQR
ncbi:hypothetical protein STEG23_034485 [Scotinomys teguina]